MKPDSTPYKPIIGNVSDVHVWEMSTYADLRGRLFKAYSSASKELFPVPFETYEHFFTESNKNVFRGMHFQGSPHAVSKVVSLVQGKAIDLLFDMRKNSQTFGFLQLINLDEATPASIYIPTGVAHGYLALEEKTIISYRMSGPFCGNCDSGFSGEMVDKLLPISIEKTIRSQRDLGLLEFDEFDYNSICDL